MATASPGPASTVDGYRKPARGGRGAAEGESSAESSAESPVESTIESATGGGPHLLERTFTVLGLFASGVPEWTTTEISSTSGLPLPTAHRIVIALTAHRYLVRDPKTKRFRLGPAAIALGQAAQSSQDLPSLAAKALPVLTERTQETSLLTVLTDSRDAAVCLQRVESPHPLRLSVQPGRQLPLHAGASQKILLAYLPDAERLAIANGPLEKLCSRTLVTPQSLLDEIAWIRERGWAHSFEETNPGVWGIAVGLLDHAGNAVAAVGIAAPQVRATRESVVLALKAVAQTAHEIATSLGLRAVGPDDVTVRPGDLPKAFAR